MAGLKTGNLTDQIAVIHDGSDRTTFGDLANISWILVIEKEVRATLENSISHVNPLERQSSVLWWKENSINTRLLVLEYLQR